MRNRQIDALKGIGIFLVVLGHTQNIFTGWIFSFHMPLFFFLTGWLRYGSREKPWGQFLSGKAKGILLPYAAFWAVSMAVDYLPPLLIAGKLPDFGWIQLRGLLLGGGYLDAGSNNFPLWYLQLLFLATVCFEGLLRYVPGKLLPLVGILLALVTIPFQTLLPGRPAFHINILPAALVFMLMGYGIRPIFSKKLEKLQKLPLALLAGAGLLVLGALISAPYNTNVSEIRRITYFPGALCSILGLYLMCSLLQKLPLLPYLGRTSLYILGLHSLLWDPSYSIADRICSLLPFRSSTLEILLVAAAATALSCLLHLLWLLVSKGRKKVLSHI